MSGNSNLQNNFETYLLGKTNSNIFDSKEHINQIYSYCYNTYKAEYTGGLDFSMEDDEIDDEISQIFREFENKKRKRNEEFSDSILSELLEDFDISIYSEEAEEEDQNKQKFFD